MEDGDLTKQLKRLDGYRAKYVQSIVDVMKPLSYNSSPYIPIWQIILFSIIE